MKTWKYKRLFEILPACISWTVILAPIALAIFWPMYLAIILLVYLSFWFVRTFVMSFFLIKGYFQYKKDIALDWFKMVKELPKERGFKDIYHVVIVPTYKENIKILESSVKSVVESEYPMDKVIYVLATEERDKENAEKSVKILKKKYSSKLFDYIAYMHPKDIPGEIIGKGPNITNAGRNILKYINDKGINPEKVIVTNMDADNVMDKKYMACLTYKYLTDEDPIHKTFQPIPMYFNNIWDVPSAMRLIAMGSSFWQMIVAMRPTRLRNFSAHAQSLETLKRVDFWSTESVVEDGHQYWRSYFGLNGRHHVISMFTPIYMDAVLAGDLWSTIKEQYLQKRRWSWGVSDIPYVMEHTFKDKVIPWFDRYINALLLWESHISWATLSIVLATSSWMPFVLNPDFGSTVTAYHFPILYSRLLMLAWIGMITTIIISTLLVPPRGDKKPKGRLILDWILTPILLPITNIALSSVPALMSHTHLALGKYLEFRVTVKSTLRSNPDPEVTHNDKSSVDK